MGVDIFMGHVWFLLTPVVRICSTNNWYLSRERIAKITIYKMRPFFDCFEFTDVSNEPAALSVQVRSS